jgi:hypothetical protein
LLCGVIIYKYILLVRVICEIYRLRLEERQISRAAIYTYFWCHFGCRHDKDVGISYGNRIRAHTHIFGVFNFKTRTFLFAFINEYFNQIGNTMKVYLSSTRDVLHWTKICVCARIRLPQEIPTSLSCLQPKWHQKYVYTLSTRYSGTTQESLFEFD